MGWTWAVYFANETVAYDVQTAGGIPGDDVRERQPFPQLSVYPTATGTYVDNVSILSFWASQATARAKLIDEKFKSAGIPLIWTQPKPVKKLDIVGAVLSFEEKSLDNKPSRLWILFLHHGPFCVGNL